jgi:hypothetical protein
MSGMQELSVRVTVFDAHKASKEHQAGIRDAVRDVSVRLGGMVQVEKRWVEEKIRSQFVEYEPMFIGYKIMKA